MKKLFKRIAYLLLILFVVINIICAIQAYHFTRFVEDYRAAPFHQMGFLDKTSAVLFGLPVAKSVVTDSLKIPHEDVSITTEDHLKLACWNVLHKPDDSIATKGTIIMFHGHGSCRSALIPEATAFYNMGWDLFMIDFRAHGNSEGSECTVGINEAKDVKAAYDFVEQNGGKNIVLYGISMGAATITTAIYDYPSIQPSKIILEMPFATMHDAVEGFVRNMNLPAEPLGTLLTFWGGTEEGVWSFSHKPEEYVKKITCPVLLQWGKEDNRVLEKETNEIFANLSSPKKTLVEYDGIGHASLCKNAPEKWRMSISGFLN